MRAGERTADWSCDECGMAFSEYGPDDLLAPTGDVPDQWRRLTGDADETTLRERPDRSTWSAIEYGGHIGDVLDWMVMALQRTREEERPRIDFFSPDRRAEDEAYNDQPYAAVTDRIEESSRRLGHVLSDADDVEWPREASYPWGDRDLLDMARNAVHEGVHHLHDVKRVLDRVTGAAV